VVEEKNQIRQLDCPDSEFRLKQTGRWNRSGVENLLNKSLTDEIGS